MTLQELLHDLLVERFGKPVREHRVERTGLPTVAQELDWLKYEQQVDVHEIGGAA